MALYLDALRRSLPAWLRYRHAEWTLLVLLIPPLLDRAGGPRSGGQAARVQAECAPP